MTIPVILLAIVSAAFLVLIVVSIIFVVILIRVMRRVHRTTMRLEEASLHWPEQIKFIGRKAAPAVVSALAAAGLRKFKRRHHE